MNFAINTTSSSGTDKAVYLKAIADAIATEIRTSVNRTFLGFVFVSGVDAFSCVGSVRNGVFRFVCTSTNTVTYAVVRDSSGAVTYREFASQTSIDALNNRIAMAGVATTLNVASNNNAGDTCFFIFDRSDGVRYKISFGTNGKLLYQKYENSAWTTVWEK